jgi:[ribosomal protein S18]-alanine N-acetyltransferase
VISESLPTLAGTRDAQSIAELSRECIEYGLAWSWRRSRVLRSILDPSINVVVSRDAGGLAGFAIMKYGEEEAHLLLLAVASHRRRRGLGTGLVQWLESCARTAGVGIIRLEARASAAGPRRFYRALGYREIGYAKGLYGGVEDGVRLAKDLWE